MAMTSRAESRVGRERGQLETSSSPQIWFACSQAVQRDGVTPMTRSACVRGKTEAARRTAFIKVFLPSAAGMRVPSSVKPNARVSAMSRRITLRSRRLVRWRRWMRISSALVSSPKETTLLGPRLNQVR